MPTFNLCLLLFLLVASTSSDNPMNLPASSTMSGQSSNNTANISNTSSHNNTYGRPNQPTPSPTSVSTAQQQQSSVVSVSGFDDILSMFSGPTSSAPTQSTTTSNTAETKRAGQGHSS